MRKRRTVAWLVACAVGLTLVPATQAMAASKHERKQDARIVKVNKRLTAAIKRAAKTATTVATLTGTVGNQAKALVDLTTLTADINGRLKTIEAGVPAVLDALTKLGDAATQLKAGLEAAGAGLTSLKTLATSQEYGVGQVLLGATPAGGSFVVTPDIPDAVQQAQTTQVFNAGAGSGQIHVLVAVRSNESDGDGTNPAAHCRVTVVDDLGHTTTSKPTPAGAGIGTAPFYPILTKSAMTSTDPANAGFMFGLKSTGADADHAVDLTDTTGGTGNAVAPDGTPATASVTKSYTVSLSCVDLSPSTTDPSA
jgi:hypothetical protein